MNTYLLYIKSHCELPDYEDEVEAPNRKEAVKILTDRINRPTYYQDDEGNEDWVAGEWDEKTISKEVGRLYKNGQIR